MKMHLCSNCVSLACQASYRTVLSCGGARERSAEGLTSAAQVFIVDDETIVASTLATILKIQGYSVLSFSNPSDAIKAAKISAPALLITDMRMPGMNGLDLAAHIKQARPDCKVILFMNQAELDDGFHIAEFEFAVIRKPIQPGKLLLHMKALGFAPPYFDHGRGSTG